MASDSRLVVRGLTDAGLREAEAEAYLALLEQGTTPAVDVARHCSVPTPRIYDVLERLERRGYVETLDRDTLHARAKHPDVVLEDLQECQERLSAVADEIEDRWEESPLGEHDVNVTKRAATVIEHAEDLIASAETSVDLAFSDERLLELVPALSEVSPDVFVRASIHDTGADVDPLADPTIRSAVREIRHRTYPSPFLAVVDRDTACFAPTESMPEPFGVLVKGDVMTMTYRWFFQTCLWAVWDPVYERGDGPAEYVSLEEFVVDCYDDLTASPTLTVECVDPGTGETKIVTGDLVDVVYTGEHDSDRAPTLTELAGEAAIELDVDGERVSIGSWGARLEDYEARRIRVESGTSPG